MTGHELALYDLADPASPTARETLFSTGRTGPSIVCAGFAHGATARPLPEQILGTNPPEVILRSLNLYRTGRPGRSESMPLGLGSSREHDLPIRTGCLDARTCGPAVAATRAPGRRSRGGIEGVKA